MKILDRSYFGLYGKFALAVSGPLLFPCSVLAQGLPVEMGSHIPVAIWFAGAAVLGIVLAYGIIRNRCRSPAEKKMTDQATKDLYAQEERDAKR
jgi:hypothetical protein